LQDLRRPERPRRCVEARAIECRRLVRILAVTQILDLGERQRQTLRKRAARGAAALVGTARDVDEVRAAGVELDALVSSSSDAGERYEPGQLELDQNNVAVPGTVYGRATGTSQISGQATLDVSAGDILTLKNVSSTALTFTPNAGGTHPDVSASIVIERLG